MKTIFSYFFYLSMRLGLFLRYRITTKGLDELKKEVFKKPGGTLFLANHPAEIDPCILLVLFWYPFRPHPVAIDYLFHMKFIRYFLDWVGALPIPNFEQSSNSYKRKQIDEVYENIFDLLRKKENLLIYPSGALKRGASEVIGGASGVHQILQSAPDTNVVLIRTTGLWGSSFSRALTGKTPKIGKTFFAAFKIILKNLILFSPRREVTVECEQASDDFPWKGSRLELNQYLEQWFNRDGPEPLTLVPYSSWKKELPKVYEKPEAEKVAYEAIPESVRKAVLEEIAEVAGLTPDKIQPTQDLALDLGLDSLDQAQLSFFLKESYGVTNVPQTELTTVECVMAFAAHLKKGEADDEDELVEDTAWSEGEGRPHVHPPEGKTVIEAFLNSTFRMDGYLACADAISGEVSYKKLRLGVILLADAIKQLPGERIGIMLPASVAVNVLIFATMLAGKVPVMINWTLGERNLKAVVDKSGIQTTISSWSFLNKLENVELNGVDEQIVLIEDIRRKLGLRQKIKAIQLARKSPQAILKKFGLSKVGEDDPAVILFTSGTENLPKGVQLSHRNLLYNQRGAYEYVSLRDKDILLGVLPPFHSFGFSITSILPILSGLRVAFLPNPTDGKRMANGIDKWKVTMVCSAPTFLKNLIRIATPDQFKTVRLVVAGAEKAPQELFDKVAELNPNSVVIEGYGITECAPVLTINLPDKKRKGVGKVLPNVELLVVHPETFEPVPLGKDGLILARGPNIFHGYLDPTIQSPFLEVGGKSWYQTGDIGSLDEEGYLTLSGRLKRFVKIGGEMISLVAIEETLLEAAPSKGWRIDPDLPSLAVTAVEVEGKKGQIYLFTIFPVTLEEVNQTLKEKGMSNLVKVTAVKQQPFIPLLGTGKTDYRALSEKLNAE